MKGITAMINKRQFLKSALVAGLAAPPLAFAFPARDRADVMQGAKAWQHWVWVNPRRNDKEAEVQLLYAAFYEAGIRGIFFEAASEMHFRAAKSNKLEAHRWI